MMPQFSLLLLLFFAIISSFRLFILIIPPFDTEHSTNSHRISHFRKYFLWFLSDLIYFGGD